MAVNNYFGKSHQLFYRMADDSVGKQNANHRLSKYLEEELVKTPRLSKKRVKASSVYRCRRSIIRTAPKERCIEKIKGL